MAPLVGAEFVALAFAGVDVSEDGVGVAGGGGKVAGHRLDDDGEVEGEAGRAEGDGVRGEVGWGLFDVVAQNAALHVRNNKTFFVHDKVLHLISENHSHTHQHRLFRIAPTPPMRRPHSQVPIARRRIQSRGQTIQALPATQLRAVAFMAAA